MRVTIDQDARWALYDAACSEIEAVSDFRIERPDHDAVERRQARDLYERLKVIGPLLDQIGWAPEDAREFFDLDFNVRAMRRFLRRQARMMEGLFGDSVVTEDQLRESMAHRERFTGKPTSEEEFAEELAEMRAQVDKDLELLAAYRRLLNVVNMPVAKLQAVA